MSKETAPKQTTPEEKEEKRHDWDELEADEYIRTRLAAYQKEQNGMGQEHGGYEDYQPLMYQKEVPVRSVDEDVVRGVMMGWLGNVGGVPDAVAIRRLHPTMIDGDDYHPEKMHYTRL
jgi:hypothetical protein